jgi:dihydroxy-acid dehydratase
VRDGDRIIIDASKCELHVELSDQELAARRTAWKPPAPRATNGVLGKYVRLVRSASEGCVTD